MLRKHKLIHSALSEIFPMIDDYSNLRPVLEENSFQAAGSRHLIMAPPAAVCEKRRKYIPVDLAAASVPQTFSRTATGAVFNDLPGQMTWSCVGLLSGLVSLRELLRGRYRYEEERRCWPGIIRIDGILV